MLARDQIAEGYITRTEPARPGARRGGLAPILWRERTLLPRLASGLPGTGGAPTCPSSLSNDTGAVRPPDSRIYPVPTLLRGYHTCEEGPLHPWARPLGHPAVCQMGRHGAL